MDSNDRDQHDYRIEVLASTFIEHAEKAEENDRRLIDEFKTNYPDDPLPEFMVNSFNIARALSVMAWEIEKLKSKFGE